MVLESMIFPIPSEAVMPFAGFLASQGKFSMLGVAIASTLGSLIGSGLSYFIGLYGGRPFLQKFGKYFLLDESHLKWAENFFEKYGDKAVLISRFIPVVRHLISIPAGTAKMNLAKFFVYTLIGATTWNMFSAWLGWKMANNWMLIKKYTHYLDYLVVLVLASGVVYFYAKLTRKKINDTEPQQEISEADLEKAK
jgi:membrane protein DedA with SNARE-associated domain